MTILLIFIGFVLSACTVATAITNVATGIVREAAYPSARIELPFQSGVKGEVLRRQFSVLNADSYAFYLHLYFKQGDNKEQERVKKLAGDGRFDSKTGRQIDTGLTIPIRLSVDYVSDAEGNRSIIDSVFTNIPFEGYTATYYIKVITVAQLNVGVYRMRIEALEDIPKLDGIPVTFDMQTKFNK